MDGEATFPLHLPLQKIVIRSEGPPGPVTTGATSHYKADFAALYLSVWDVGLAVFVGDHENQLKIVAAAIQSVTVTIDRAQGRGSDVSVFVSHAHSGDNQRHLFYKLDTASSEFSADKLEQLKQILQMWSAAIGFACSIPSQRAVEPAMSSEGSFEDAVVQPTRRTTRKLAKPAPAPLPPRKASTSKLSTKPSTTPKAQILPGPFSSRARKPEGDDAGEGSERRRSRGARKPMQDDFVDWTSAKPKDGREGRGGPPKAALPKKRPRSVSPELFVPQEAPRQAANAEHKRKEARRQTLPAIQVAQPSSPAVPHQPFSRAARRTGKGKAVAREPVADFFGKRRSGASVQVDTSGQADMSGAGPSRQRQLHSLQEPHQPAASPEANSTPQPPVVDLPSPPHNPVIRPNEALPVERLFTLKRRLESAATSGLVHSQAISSAAESLLESVRALRAPGEANPTLHGLLASVASASSLNELACLELERQLQHELDRVRREEKARRASEAELVTRLCAAFSKVHSQEEYDSTLDHFRRTFWEQQGWGAVAADAPS